MESSLYQIIGNVSRVLGPVVHAKSMIPAQMLELVEVGEDRLIGEVVRLQEDTIVIQVYEDTTGIKPGTVVYGSGTPLSVELGPGLMGSIYDGVQRPLESIKAATGYIIKRGVKIDPLDHKRKWPFSPRVKKGDTVTPGQIVGTVQETDLIEHRILVPPGI